MSESIEPLSQEELGAFMDGLTTYLFSEAPEPERLEAAMAIAKGKLSEESIAPAVKQESVSKDLEEEIAGLQEIYAQAFKQDYLIHVVTETIAPVLVSAFTQEEAEHLALEKIKSEVAAAELEISESLARLWEVIGVGGSRLDDWEKESFITALCVLLRYCEGSLVCSSVWEGLEPAWTHGDIPNFDNTNPPLSEGNIREVLNIPLTHRDCWQAISEIAAAQLAAERGER